MNRLLIIFLFVLGCSPAVNTANQKDSKNPKPDWLLAKPDQSIYYIGIGQSRKDGTSNFIQKAKKSALEDLVSEIK